MDENQKPKIDVDGLTKRIEDKRKSIDENLQNDFSCLVNKVREQVNFVNENLLGQANDLIKVYLSLTANRLDHEMNDFFCNKPDKIGFCNNPTIAISVYMTVYCKCNEHVIVGAKDKKLIFKTTGEGMMPEQCDESYDALEWLESVKDLKLRHIKFNRIHTSLGVYQICLRTLINGFGKFRDDFLAHVEEQLK